MSQNDSPESSFTSRQNKCLICFTELTKTSETPSDSNDIKKAKIVLETVLSVPPNVWTRLSEEENNPDSENIFKSIKFCEKCSTLADKSLSLHDEMQKIKADIITGIRKSSRESATKKDENVESISFTEIIRDLFWENGEPTGNIDPDPVEKGKKRRLSSEEEEEQEIVGFPMSTNDEISLESLNFAVVEREAKVARTSRMPYFCFTLLMEESNKKFLVEALFFGGIFRRAYDFLQPGYHYVFNGLIERKPQDPYFAIRSKSEAGYKYIFSEMDNIDRDDSKRRVNVDPSQQFFVGDMLTIQKITQLVSARPRQVFRYRLVKGVKLVSGEVYRYFGCKSCQKSNPLHIGGGTYRCISCRNYGKPEEILEILMMTRKITIMDSSGNKLENLICFNNVAKMLLKKEASDYVYDNEAQKDFDALKGAVMNLRLSFQRSDSELNFSGYNLVINFIQRDESSSSTTDFGVSADPIPKREDLPVTPMGLSVTITAKKEIKIEPPRGYFNYIPSDTEYQLNTEPSGYALIITVCMYDVKGETEGFMMDFIKVRGLFRSLNFKVYGNNPYETIGREKLEKKIEHFKDELKYSNVGSCAVVVLGHGSFQRLRLSTDERVNIDECIISQFSSVNFPEFIMKPKLFVFNMCQIYMKDEAQIYPTPVIENAYFCFSTLPGHYSIFQVENGSFFIDRLVHVMEKMAGNNDLRCILTEVERFMLESYQHFKMQRSDGSFEWAELVPSWHCGRLFNKLKFVVRDCLLPTELDDAYNRAIKVYPRQIIPVPMDQD